MPRPRKYPELGGISEVLKYERLYVTCPRCGDKGMLKTVAGYLIVRHSHTTHMVKAEEIQQVIGEIKEEIEKKIKGLQRLLEITGLAQ